jgi:hypothetical protein
MRAFRVPRALQRAVLLASAPFSLAFMGCARPESAPNETSPPLPTSSTPLSSRQPDRIAIPSGTFQSGTAPGAHPRDPALEPGLASVTLGPYSIDARLFAGEAGMPRTGLTRFEADVLCGERGGRLCTELEWERACKGPASDVYAGGSALDGACVNAPAPCASGFGVLGMGSLSEWTRSEVELPGSAPGALAAVRGANPGDAVESRRCARREALAPETRAGWLGFRCCYGPPNAAAVSSAKLGRTFEQTTLPVAELTKLLASEPATSALAREVVYFRDPDASQSVVGRGGGDTRGFFFTAAPLLWNPAAGARFLVVAARSGERTSFVATYHVVAAGQYRLASSFVMQDEPGPVVLGYNGYIRPRLHFSTCWGCPGESGKILYRDPDRVAILQP